MFSQKQNEIVSAYAFLLPAIILLVAFILVPMALSVYYSLTDYYLLKPAQKQFVFFKNYLSIIFSDDTARNAMRNTIVFVLLVLPLQLGLAFFLALIINRSIRGMVIFKVSYFAPSILSMVVLAILWKVMLNPNSGLVNAFLSWFGISPQPFLTSPDQALISIVMLSAWQGAGVQMLIFLAGLKNIPQHFYEMAVIDGANVLQQFFHVTLPSLKPITTFLVITTTISAFKLIIQPLIMTNGGPNESTVTVLQHMFVEGFRYRNIGYASAIAVLFVVLITIIALALNRFAEGRDKP